MIKAILFDLDDTLLGNHIDTFLPQYFKQLGQYTASLMPHDRFIPLLLACTREAIESTNMSKTNRDVFYSALTRETGWDAGEVELFFDRYYQTEFPKLREFTRPRPCAPHVVRYCLEAGYQVVVATNPLFPRAAIEERLAWAGVPVTEFEFELVTTIENMHATKPSRLYYEEILSRIKCAPEQALMVGDSWENDISPAAALGLKTFWVPPAAETPVEDETLLYGSGTLAEFYEYVKTGWLRTL